MGCKEKFMIGESALRAESKQIAEKFKVKGVVLIVLHQNECEFAHFWPEKKTPLHIDEIVAAVGMEIANDENEKN